VAGAKDGVVIERKTASDFLGTITSGRDRWERELRRARLDCRELVVIIEASFALVMAKRGIMSEESLIGTVASLARRGVPVIFAGSEEAAARLTFAILTQPVRSIERQLKSIRFQGRKKIKEVEE
jgi:ERCC4-type nuclease